MIAQKLAPLRRRRPRLGALHRLHQRSAIRGRQGMEQMLIDVEVEHHLHPLAGRAEIFHVRIRQVHWLRQE